eukprot:760026-Amphidinium_carterae.1
MLFLERKKQNKTKQLHTITSKPGRNSGKGGGLAIEEHMLKGPPGWLRRVPLSFHAEQAAEAAPSRNPSRRKANKRTWGPPGNTSIEQLRTARDVRKLQVGD